MRHQFLGHLIHRRLRLWAAALAMAPLAAALISSQTENAIANGDTRSLTIYHVHTKESTTVTFRVNGSYDSAALEKLNWALRDWRRDEPTKMDPRLFDVVWEVYHEVGSGQPIWIMSAYRSPETNAMLRRRSRAVAKFSQHMLGKAMDVHMPDMSMQKVRDIAMRLQRGGVGYYPTAGTPFVHIDVGSVRYWPRMGRDEMARIFPDGKTVDIPADGQPMPRYNEALAEIQARGGAAYSASVEAGRSGGLLAALFGGGEDDEGSAAAPSTGRRVASLDGNDRGRNFLSSTQTKGGSPLAWAAAPAVAPAAPILVAARVPAAKDAPKPQVIPEVVAQQNAEADAPAEPPAPLIPMPPRRPTELVVADLGPVPMPPTRPVDLAVLKASAMDSAPTASISAKLATAVPAAAVVAAPAKPPITGTRSAGLPDVITQGTSRPVRQAGVLAFAEVPPTRSFDIPSTRSFDIPPSAATPPAAAAAPLRRQAAALSPKRTKPALVAARIDRSNFRTLTAPAPTARATSYAALGAGSGLAPLRAAARLDADAIMFGPTVDAVAKFGRTANASLQPDCFSGPAVKALSVADGFDMLGGASSLE